MKASETKHAHESLIINCDNCKNEGWVCENHPNTPWNYGDCLCCGGAGAPCKKCNDGRDVRMIDGTYLRAV